MWIGWEWIHTLEIGKEKAVLNLINMISWILLYFKASMTVAVPF
jgi:hypothetical protein